MSSTQARFSCSVRGDVFFLLLLLSLFRTIIGDDDEEEDVGSGLGCIFPSTLARLGGVICRERMIMVSLSST